MGSEPQSCIQGVKDDEQLQVLSALQQQDEQQHNDSTRNAQSPQLLRNQHTHIHTATQHRRHRSRRQQHHQAVVSPHLVILFVVLSVALIGLIRSAEPEHIAAARRQQAANDFVTHVSELVKGQEEDTTSGSHGSEHGRRKSAAGSTLEEDRPSPLSCDCRADPSCGLGVDVSSCGSSHHDQVAVSNFNQIYSKKVWGVVEESHTRSGSGSNMKGAFDWIIGLTKFLQQQQQQVQTIADIPSGDVGWQMSVRAINTAKVYFGGDIASSVAAENAIKFAAHKNKFFHHWDLHACGVPKWFNRCEAPQRRASQAKPQTLMADGDRQQDGDSTSSSSMFSPDEDDSNNSHNKKLPVSSPPLPAHTTSTASSTSTTSTLHAFDLVVVRDALQHIPIVKVQTILKKIVLESGAKWLAVSTYNPGQLRPPERQFCNNTQQRDRSSIGVGASSPVSSRRFASPRVGGGGGASGPGNGDASSGMQFFCSEGDITDGGWYRNMLDCPPFLFPTPAFSTHSHKTFSEEDDFLHIYRIDAALKSLVKRMPDCTPYLSKTRSGGRGKN